MYYLNKVISLILSPAFIGMVIFALGFVAVALGRRRMALSLGGLAAIWFFFWMSPATYRWLSTNLESRFPVLAVEKLPQADAIRILGGGMGANTNAYPYSEMWGGADRVWHGARLYKAGKAPRVFVTCWADIPLLVDLGVPREAITLCDKARNTEEEARFIAEAMQRVQSSETVSSLGFSVQSSETVSSLGFSVQSSETVSSLGFSVQRSDDNSKHSTLNSKLNTINAKLERPKVLLVTSAWHMRRAMLMFQRYAPELEIIPAATDYEALVRYGWKTGFQWEDLIPSAEMFFQNSYMIKEIIGYYGYLWFRK